MKRIISLLLCVLMSFLSLTGCSKSTLDQFKEDQKQYDDVKLKEDREEIELDLYIICEEGTTDSAKVSVERDINTYLMSYKTTLDIHYLTADQYKAELDKGVAATGEDRADIVLIAGNDMFTSLMSTNSLADLTSLYSTRKYSSLKTQIAHSLLQSSEQKVQSMDVSSGEIRTYTRYYSVPNNHVVGEYQYLLINTAKAQYHNFGETKLANMTTYESTLELRELIGADADEYVKQVSGKYVDKAKYEAEGYTVNIVSYPTATLDEAFASAFGIVRHELDTRYLYELDKKKDEKISKENRTVFEAHYERCMEIIYAINTDAKLRNLLQYGSLGTNYTYDEDTNTVTRVTDGPVYKMNLLYTGDIFKAYYCDDVYMNPAYSIVEVLDWNEAEKDNGTSQNMQSVVDAAINSEN